MSASPPTVTRLIRSPVSAVNGDMSSFPNVASSQWARLPAWSGTDVPVRPKIALNSRTAFAPVNVSPTIHWLNTVAPGVKPRACPISCVSTSMRGAVPKLMSLGSMPVMPA